MKFGAALSVGFFAVFAVGAAFADDLSTQKRVQGIITQVEGVNVTICTQGSQAKSLTGKIDPKSTKIVVQGHTGAASDLKVAASARGELGLDDVWVSVVVR